MYIVTILPHGHLTPSGKPATSFNEQDNIGIALAKIVLPFELVSEFDTWLNDSLQPRHIERPSKIIEEYGDPEGPWQGSEGLQVIYYIMVDENQLEEVEKFSDTYADQRK